MAIAITREDYEKKFGITPTGETVAPKPVAQKKDFLTKATDVATAIFPGTRAIGESLGTAALNIGKLAKGQNPDIPVNIPATIGGYASAGAQVLGYGGIGATGGVLSKAAQSAGLGATVSGGTAASKGANLKETAESAALGAGIGAGASMAFSGAEAFLKNFQKLPQRLVRSATGQSKQQILAGKDITPYVLRTVAAPIAPGIPPTAPPSVPEIKSPKPIT